MNDYLEIFWADWPDPRRPEPRRIGRRPTCKPEKYDEPHT